MEVDREAVVKYKETHTINQTAEYFGLPISTVRNWIYRHRNRTENGGNQGTENLPVLSGEIVGMSSVISDGEYPTPSASVNVPQIAKDWRAVERKYIKHLLKVADKAQPRDASIIAGIAADKYQDYTQGRRGNTNVNVDNRQVFIGSDIARAAIKARRSADDS